MRIVAVNPKGMRELAELVNRCPATTILGEVSLPATPESVKTAIAVGAWPTAVDPTLVVSRDDEPAKRIRAANIVMSYFGTDLTGKRLLDFGCGQGHCTADAAGRGAHAVGYDPQPDDWAARSGGILTSDEQAVVDHGPYDYILAYDVLDHVLDDSQPRILGLWRRLLAPGGLVTVRCHPWVGVHGPHLYYTVNRAFAHLLLDPPELDELGGRLESNAGVLYPLSTYRSWIKQSGLRTVKENVVSAPLAETFRDDDLINLIIGRHYSDDLSMTPDRLREILEIQFVDYVLAAD